VRERGYIVICDFLQGDGTHDVELTFQFAPGALRPAGDSAIFEERVRLHWFGPEPLLARIHEGGHGPDEGWIAPSLGVKAPAPRLVLAASLEVPAVLISVVSDLPPDGSPVPAVSAPSAGQIRIAGAGWTEWLLVNTKGQSAADGLQSDAHVAAWVETTGGLVADGRVGGTFQRP
jgi:hypothetical protein